MGQLIESGSPSPQVFAASRQLVLADRIQRRALEILQNTGDSTAIAAQLGQEVTLFEQVLYALRNGNARMGITPVRNPQASSSLNQVRRQYEAVKPQLEVILDASQNLLDIRQAADRIFSESDLMFDHARTLAVAIAELPQERLWPSSRANTAALGLLIVLALALLVLVMITASRRADTAVRHNRKAQQAIIKLLDDLGALGEGDLTVRADVNDEITGAIADGVNYAVEQLRGLVLGVNETARAVADSADTTRRATERLAASAEEQAGQVVRATEKVQSMSSAFGAMADRSRKSRDTALESVEAAHSGAERVRETITGMDRIREQIQETSKRIKRLGESTQEIGDIVKMINDIAEQTNVLALNAAIQAASAGSSGQGFGMVADEVQQLAESATSATRRISTLVETIQIDTGEAITSMEETTSEVVSGARL
ncbi:MAG: methyl-accepting chemotaxis protein, partial [Gammaproteobacteria bacterium]